jgi:hypothetical protein
MSSNFTFSSKSTGSKGTSTTEHAQSDALSGPSLLISAAETLLAVSEAYHGQSVHESSQHTSAPPSKKARTDEGSGSAFQPPQSPEASLSASHSPSSFACDARLLANLAQTVPSASGGYVRPHLQHLPQHVPHSPYNRALYSAMNVRRQRRLPAVESLRWLHAAAAYSQGHMLKTPAGSPLVNSLTPGMYLPPIHIGSPTMAAAALHAQGLV